MLEKKEMGMKNQGFISDYLTEMKTVAEKISQEDIDEVVELLYDTWRQDRRVFICGNGGSAGTATHFACDLAKTTIVDSKRRFKAICLNDNAPLISALTNDNGFDNLYTEQLENLYQPGDVLICISVHGGAGRDKAGLWSQNLLKAMKYVEDNGGKTVGFSGFDGGPMKEIADACVVVPANSTPQVESFHLALEHLVCSCLREKIMAN
jgi:D-sedoheptulose 7-phosphate isomerase